MVSGKESVKASDKTIEESKKSRESDVPAEIVEQQKAEEKEEKGFDIRMIEEMKLQGKKEIVSTKKWKPWIDVSKTEEGKKVAEFNNRTIFKMDYISYAKAANDQYTRDLV